MQDRDPAPGPLGDTQETPPGAGGSPDPAPSGSPRTGPKRDTAPKPKARATAGTTRAKATPGKKRAAPNAGARKRGASASAKSAAKKPEPMVRYTELEGRVHRVRFMGETVVLRPRETTQSLPGHAARHPEWSALCRRGVCSMETVRSQRTSAGAAKGGKKARGGKKTSTGKKKGAPPLKRTGGERPR